MAKKILIFLSPTPKNAEEISYDTPWGTDVKGVQTNQAPTLALLERHPQVTTIIAFLTKEVQGQAWEDFQAYISKHHEKELRFEGILLEDFQISQEPLGKLLSLIQDKDEILIESTGGPRNAVIHLIFIGRVLASRGIPVSQVVYSNFQTSQIEDITPTFQLFDLVSGLDQMISLGNVKALEAYYQKTETPAKVRTLLDALKDFSNTLALCRTETMDEKAERLDQALKDAETIDDPLIAHLLPVFREKFGDKITTPGIVRWCVNNDMLQQALTIYTERMPKYFFDRGLLFIENPPEKPPADQRDFYTILFWDDFLGKEYKIIISFKKYVHDNPELSNPRREFSKGVDNLRYIQDLAFCGGRYNPGWVKHYRGNRDLKKRLRSAFNYNSSRPTSKVNLIERCVGLKTDALFFLLEQPEPEYDVKIMAIEELTENTNGFQVCCSISAMQTICRDYLYIKAVRNMTNHANEQSKPNKISTNDYLYDHDYPNMDELTVPQLKEVLLQCLEHMEATVAERR